MHVYYSDKLHIVIKVQPNHSEHWSPTRLSMQDQSYLTNAVLTTVAFLLLLHTNSLPHEGFTHYSQLPETAPLIKLLPCESQCHMRKQKIKTHYDAIDELINEH